MAEILVVDDDPDFAVICRMILKEAGYEVRVAANGRIALDEMRREKPDLILLDVMLTTILEGVEVSKEMKADPILKDIPIVMVSSIATSEHASLFPDDEPMPIDAWISKPIQPTMMLRTIERLLNERMLRAA